jgi:hypothetical protein
MFNNKEFFKARADSRDMSNRSENGGWAMGGGRGGGAGRGGVRNQRLV